VSGDVRSPLTDKELDEAIYLACFPNSMGIDDIMVKDFSLDKVDIVNNFISDRVFYAI